MNDLDELLRETGRDLVLQAPLTDVSARGRHLRRRRHARVAGASAAASVAVAGGVLAVTNATSAPPTTGPDLVAVGWSESLNGLPSGVRSDYADLCRTLGNDMVDNNPRSATEVFDSAPVASAPVDTPGGELAVLVFHSKGAFASCVVDPDGPDGPFVTMAQSLPTLAETGTFVTPTGTYGSADLSIATGVTSPEVADVQITIDGTAIDAAVDNGIFAAVVPNDAGHQTLLASTVEAYDADGAVLEEVPLLP